MSERRWTATGDTNGDWHAIQGPPIEKGEVLLPAADYDRERERAEKLAARLAAIRFVCDPSGDPPPDLAGRDVSFTRKRIRTLASLPELSPALGPCICGAKQRHGWHDSECPAMKPAPTLPEPAPGDDK